ncbi:MAG: PEP-CTERM sorting domain-containing protein [Bryobacterales bacterium]|nr:PEP-CTERM sorting domain-containing protein [Bryobacterales bacterium]
MLRLNSAVGIAGALALACGTVCQAGVATFATTSFGNNPHSGTGSTFSQTYARTSYLGGSPVFSGESYTTPPAVCAGLCLYTGFNEYSEASIDSTTGRGRGYALSSFDGTLDGTDGGAAEAGFTLTDTLEIDFSSPFFVSLDLTLAASSLSAGSGIIEFASWSAVYEAKFTSVDDTSPAISILIDISQNQDAGVLFTLYRISTDDLNGGRQVIEEGTSLPDRFHVKAEVPGLPVPAPVKSYNLELSLYVNATCATFGAPGCHALVSSPNSSYISFDGNYTSANGYGYVGVVDAVPEPSTMVLFGVGVMLLAVRRRKPKADSRKLIAES